MVGDWFGVILEDRANVTLVSSLPDLGVVFHCEPRTQRHAQSSVSPLSRVIPVNGRPLGQDI